MFELTEQTLCKYPGHGIGLSPSITSWYKDKLGSKWVLSTANSRARQEDSAVEHGHFTFTYSSMGLFSEVLLT